MDIRIEGLHEQALLRLKKVNGLKTPVAMVRALIADAAKEEGVWPDAAAIESNDLPQGELRVLAEVAQ